MRSDGGELRQRGERRQQNESELAGLVTLTVGKHAEHRADSAERAQQQQRALRYAGTLLDRRRFVDAERQPAQQIGGNDGSP